MHLGVTETQVTEAVAAVRDATERAERPSSDATDEEKKAACDAHRTAFVSALADELGVDESELTDALSDIREDKQAERAGKQGERAEKGDRG